MSGASLGDPPSETLEAPAPGAADELAALRRLLLSPEQEQLGELRERLDDPALHARDVSRVLAEAIVLRYREDEQLSRALTPIVVDALKRAIREEPGIVVDIVFPVIGPAIRRAVAESFRELSARINRALAAAFSLRGLRWRWQAWRTGRPFAEIVMLHSLVYRVEQAFLVHRETGLVLAHVVAPDVTAQDEDATAGMLAAIRDFSRDAFGTGEHEGVDRLQVGELTVWVEPGPEAFVAAVIRGVPPAELRETLQEAVEGVHRDLAEELRGFAGDTSPFAAATAALEDCLLSATAAED